MAASAAGTGVFKHFWRGSAVIGPLARASGTRKYRAIGDNTVFPCGGRAVLNRTRYARLP